MPQVLQLLHKVPGNIPTPVNFYIYRAQSNVSARGNKLPLLFLMNGANVEAKQYSQVSVLKAVNTVRLRSVYTDVALQNTSAAGPDMGLNWLCVFKFWPLCPASVQCYCLTQQDNHIMQLEVFFILQLAVRLHASLADCRAAQWQRLHIHRLGLLSAPPTFIPDGTCQQHEAQGRILPR